MNCKDPGRGDARMDPDKGVRHSSTNAALSRETGSKQDSERVVRRKRERVKGLGTKGTWVIGPPLGHATSSTAGLAAGAWSLESPLVSWDWPCPEDFSSSPEAETGPALRDSDESWPEYNIHVG